MYVCVFYNDAWSLFLWELPCLLSFPLSPELLTFHLSECTQIYVHKIYLLCVATPLSSKRTHRKKTAALYDLGVVLDQSQLVAAAESQIYPPLCRHGEFALSGVGLLSGNR